jgi:hypothetical protein
MSSIITNKSILCFILFFHPLLKVFKCIILLQLGPLNCSILVSNANLFIYKVIIESDLLRLLFPVTEIKLVHSTPIYCSQAHWTWLAAAVYHKALQLKVINLFARISYCNNLCMKSRIFHSRHHIMTFCNYIAFLISNECPKRP